MTILYEVHNNLYVNLTNRCPCACTFCLRQTRSDMGGGDPLWLDHEPGIDEVKDAFSHVDMDNYKELVFCGFGEPTEALDVLIKTARFVKDKYKKPIRINTNGLGNLINNKDILPDLKGLVDTLSISLNTPDEEKYMAICRPKFGSGSFEAMLFFAKKAKNYVPNVVMTTVSGTISKEEEGECQKICDDLGVNYRIRPWEG